MGAVDVELLILVDVDDALDVVMVIIVVKEVLLLEVVVDEGTDDDVVGIAELMLIEVLAMAIEVFEALLVLNGLVLVLLLVSETVELIVELVLRLVEEDIVEDDVDVLFKVVLVEVVLTIELEVLWTELEETELVVVVVVELDETIVDNGVADLDVVDDTVETVVCTDEAEVEEGDMEVEVEV